MAAASLKAVVAYVRRIADPDARGVTDRHLLERFTSEHDQAAFAELVRRHGPMVLATCRRVLRHEQDAEDAFQAAFLVLARKAASIRQGESIGGWLYQVSHRLAVRAKVLGVARQRRFAPLNEDVADRSTPSLHANLDEELQRLPEPYRAAIILCYLEGRTQLEAARLLATTADAVNGRLKRARDLLRHRLAISAAAAAQTLTAATAQGALTPALIQRTAHAALQFITGQAATSGASAVAIALAHGALHNMIAPKIKLLSVLVLAVTLMTTGALLLPPASGENAVPKAAQGGLPILAPKDAPGDKAKPQRSCIILWMNGGPSQLDTFDPKDGDVSLFKAIDTNVKGLQFAETLPKLAKQANHLAVIRSLTHRTGDHGRGAYLMRTGYEQGPAVNVPSLGCVLAKELGAGRPDLPRYFLFGAGIRHGSDPGYLGEQYAPITVKGNQCVLPDAEAFEARATGKGETHRKAVEKAFDLADEKAELRDAYGHGSFGVTCLLARRLIERDVPVVEVSLGGWDVHANAAAGMQNRCIDLDSAFATLVKDLHERKKLDSTLIVWMGEFGRTPVVNQNAGRDHYPQAFSVVLAGSGIKGGQAIGKTSANGVEIEERPVTPQELLATIYQALSVDASKKNRTPAGQLVPYVEKESKAIKEALR